MEAKRLADDLQVTRRNEKKLKEQIQKLIAQSQIDEDCNKSLQVNVPAPQPSLQIVMACAK